MASVFLTSRDAARSTATPASSQAPAKRRRVTKTKITQITEEEIVEDSQPTGSLNAATVKLFMTALQNEMGPMQAQVEALQKRLDRDIDDIDDNESKEDEEEIRSSDEESQSPKRAQLTQPDYGTRGKTPAAKQGTFRATF
ncbi:hypothetical protein CC86DRAFT_409033 [Ophiobolus disseminans]|uniref:Uncharacterized protein n=1 Tax=Ophiobolus disseminans TaxID=1469910 RepID=A0A6A6ZSF9_9PLEO|nr:hypothetical protein CC86DRAFT_409033 [Ophiobolus disseminans]